MAEKPVIFMKKIDASLSDFRDGLNEISPSFCAAKWKQVTIHLQNGHTHSCHHPGTHKIPIEELSNPSALHNTNFKKEQRKKMLCGERPAECDYCWRVEDSNSESFSDRVFKSKESWAAPYITDIINKPWDDDVNPSYVEVSFGNVCNFKCSYCAPHISSPWMEEIEKHGAYPTSTQFNNIHWIKEQDMMPIPHKEHNPYVEAFWKWWPSLYKDLQHFRITGGEPLLNKNTFKVLDYIIDNPNPNLDFSINSNLCPPPQLLDNAIEKIKRIIGEGKVKKFKIFTSAEAHGPQAEYIRFGMNYQQWLDNIYKLYNEVPEMDITIMSTYNILSLTTYIPFLKDVLAIKQEFGGHNRVRAPMLLDIPYLRFPEHQSIFTIEPQLLHMIYEQVTFMFQNLEYKDWYGTANMGFYENEADKLKRVYNIAKSSLEKENPWRDTNRKDFVKFVDEHDRRRGTDFLKTFPELEETYLKWKTIQ